MGGPRYSVLIPPDTQSRAAAYLKALQAGQVQAGGYLRQQLATNDGLAGLSALDLLGRLCDSKRPQIFAETEVVGDGSDWSPLELSLLGDLSVSVPVTVFDDGHHTAPTPHTPPFAGVLVFTAGALLRNGHGHTPADWPEVVGPDGQISSEGYYALYRRRLTPVLRAINAQAGQPRSALVTVPGLGCGQFAGRFRGQLGGRLQAVLERLLRELGPSLPNLKALYFDPYREGGIDSQEIHGIAYRVRPLRAAGGGGRPQLCHPLQVAEPNDAFEDCRLFSIVAWDPVSWPGNDYYIGSRCTDDGVKAAATDCMARITGLAGHYDVEAKLYRPPAPYATWDAVVRDRRRRHQLRLWQPPADTGARSGG